MKRIQASFYQIFLEHSAFSSILQLVFDNFGVLQYVDLQGITNQLSAHRRFRFIVTYSNLFVLKIMKLQSVSGIKQVATYNSYHCYHFTKKLICPYIPQCYLISVAW